ncbi:BRO1-domain-containing protein [Neoconidiobolus thromboides FSU 785]|nr:BRO1-domain-containing protein [Neoconidiobolus thromboides FSU 785]
MSNLLKLAYKRSPTIELASAYQTIYELEDEIMNQYHNDLNRLDRLRQDSFGTFTLLKDGSSIDHSELWLKYYYGLCMAIHKLPIFKVSFSWSNINQEDAYIEESNLYFELINVLYNISAYYSHLAELEDRNSIESIKKSCAYFEYSAGILQFLLDRLHIKNEYPIQNIPKDLSYSSLSCLLNLILAQVQECIWQVAVIGNKKNSVLVKLAGHVSKLYELSYISSINEQVENVFEKTFKHHLKIKMLHFKAVAYYRQALDFNDVKNKELAYLKKAKLIVEEANKLIVENLKQEIIDDLICLTRVIVLRVSFLMKQKEYITFESEITINEELATFNMAQAKLPKQMEDLKELIIQLKEKSIFNYLKPYLLQRAPELYQTKKNEFINYNILKPLELWLEQNKSNKKEEDEVIDLNLSKQLLEKIKEIQEQGGYDNLKLKFDNIQELRNQTHDYIKNKYEICLKWISDKINGIQLNEIKIQQIEMFKKKPKLLLIKLEEAIQLDKKHFENYLDIENDLIFLNNLVIDNDCNSFKFKKNQSNEHQFNYNQVDNKKKEIMEFQLNDNLNINELKWNDNNKFEMNDLENLIQIELKKYLPYLKFIKELNQFTNNKSNQFNTTITTPSGNLIQEACNTFELLNNNLNQGFKFYTLLKQRMDKVMEECSILINKL